jgi:hypothetical protein
VNEAQPVPPEPNHLAAQIEHAVWQAVEVLWGVNAAVKPSSVSIQTKLV